MAIDDENLQESDSSPERKHLQMRGGISPSTIEDWSDKESVPCLANLNEIDDSVPADDIEFVQNIEMPHSKY